MLLPIKEFEKRPGWLSVESTLHLCELLGGWPTAFVAQRVLRHKTAKGSYRLIFGMTVFLDQVAAADFISGGILSREIVSRVRSLAT